MGAPRVRVEQEQILRRRQPRGTPTATRASERQCSSSNLEEVEDLVDLEDLGHLLDKVVSPLQFRRNLEAGSST